MTEKEFLIILKKYESGEANADEKLLVERWYLSLGKNEKPFLNGKNDYLVESQLLTSIGKHISGTSATRTVFFTPYFYKIAAAASVIFILLTAMYYYTSTTAIEPLDQKMTSSEAISDDEYKIVNDNDTVKLVVLADGSRISLAAHSSLWYKKDFNDGDRREVHLNGEAFFEVAHNPQKPFFVYTNEITTKVLGTSFKVRAFDHGDEIKIEVKTGRVCVFPSKEQTQPARLDEQVVLTPNQLAIYDRDKQVVTKSVVETPEILVTESEVKKMRFTAAPVSEIFKGLEQVYGIKFQYDEVVFASCRLTTTISGDGMYSKLDVICRSIGASYQEANGKFIIHGKGCN